MAEEVAGITTTDPISLAIQVGDRDWKEIEGTLDFVDGVFHKIQFPGFMTRSGGSFGVTATFHVVERAWKDGEQMRGDIARWVMVNGLLRTVDTVERGVDLV